MNNTEKSHLVGVGNRSSILSLQNDNHVDQKSDFRLLSYFRSHGVNKEVLMNRYRYEDFIRSH